MKINLAELEKKIKSEKVFVIGNPLREITKIASPEKADKNSLCVVWDRKAVEKLDIDIPIVAPEDFFEHDRDGLVCEKPRALLPELLGLFSCVKNRPKGIHPAAVVAEEADVSSEAFVGAYAVIESGAVIEAEAIVSSGVFIGGNCFIGRGSVIEPRAVLMSDVRIGKNCLIHSGAVIGCDGFGFVPGSDGIVKIPQVGGVTIGDDVEVGACTTIDRGTLSDTFVGSGTKIDNHVQIGHNVKIGRNCIICSMSGIAGSTTIEDGVTVSVQAGITDHVTIGAGAILAARTGVTNDIAPGALVSGFPARPHNEAKRALVLAADLPSLFKRVRHIERKLNELQTDN